MRYTYIRQHDTTDCAAACLAMVCLHYKKEVTITRLRDMMGTDLKGIHQLCTHTYKTRCVCHKSVTHPFFVCVSIYSS